MTGVNCADARGAIAIRTRPPIPLTVLDRVCTSITRTLFYVIPGPVTLLRDLRHPDATVHLLLLGPVMIGMAFGTIRGCRVGARSMTLAAGFDARQQDIGGHGAGEGAPVAFCADHHLMRVMIKRRVLEPSGRNAGRGDFGNRG